jgi:hypothetical protein
VPLPHYTACCAGTAAPARTRSAYVGGRVTPARGRCLARSSLLTFLSYDLTADVDSKLSWIDAILKRLDVRDPALAPHIRCGLTRGPQALGPQPRRACVCVWVCV